MGLLYHPGTNFLIGQNVYRIMGPLCWLENRHMCVHVTIVACLLELYIML